MFKACVVCERIDATQNIIIIIIILNLKTKNGDIYETKNQFSAMGGWMFAVVGVIIFLVLIVLLFLYLFCYHDQYKRELQKLCFRQERSREEPVREITESSLEPRGRVVYNSNTVQLDVAGNNRGTHEASTSYLDESAGMTTGLRPHRPRTKNSLAARNKRPSFEDEDDGVPETELRDVSSAAPAAPPPSYVDVVLNENRYHINN